MGIFRWVLAFLVMLTMSCSSLITGAAVVGVTVLTAGAGAPPMVTAAIAGVTAFGVDVYMDTLDSYTIEPPPTNAFARIIYEIRKLGVVLIYGGILVFVIIPFLFKGGRKRVGKIVRGLTGNTAPKKWTVENYERLNKIDEQLEGLSEKK